MQGCYGAISIGPITYDQCTIYKIIHCLDKVTSEIELIRIAGCIVMVVSVTVICLKPLRYCLHVINRDI